MTDFATVIHCAFENAAPKGTPAVVAIVKINVEGDPEDNLNVVYEKTNTIDKVWWENEGVLPIFRKKGCRSTSIGDIIKINNDFWTVASFGFDKLDGVPIEWHLARERRAHARLKEWQDVRN